MCKERGRQFVYPTGNKKLITLRTQQVFMALAGRFYAMGHGDVEGFNREAVQAGRCVVVDPRWLPAPDGRLWPTIAFSLLPDVRMNGTATGTSAL